VLEKLYERHGYYLEGVKSITFTGLDGMDKMQNIMTKLRKKPIRVIGDLAVQYIEDYLSRISTAADGKVSDIQLPAANAVKLILERSAWICIRPSGTEPKIKIYYAVREAKRKAAESQLKNIANSFEQMI
jgi:phosphoglucomutase